MGTRADIAKRFWEKVDIRGPDECWEWKASRFKGTGYGQFSLYGKPTTAQRVAYYLTNGYLPVGDACHSCDNRGCVNPAHIFQGTRLDNVQDMIAKNRHSHGAAHAAATPVEKRAKGERNGHAKLTERAVREIRRRILEGERHYLVAADYHISREAVTRIANHRTWKHVVE